MRVEIFDENDENPIIVDHEFEDFHTQMDKTIFKIVEETGEYLGPCPCCGERIRMKKLPEA